MSSDFSSDLTIDPATARGRDWPCLRQFCVFMENRVGRLHDLLRQVERHDLKVVGLSMIDTVDFAVARIMLDNADRARETLTLGGYTFMESDVLGVVLPDDPQPFLMIFTSLISAELNIHYTYPQLFRRQGRGAIALHLDDLDQATQILTAAGVQLITEGDLLEGDEFL
jgi:hypothetical protein